MPDNTRSSDFYSTYRIHCCKQNQTGASKIMHCMDFNHTYLCFLLIDHPPGL